MFDAMQGRLPLTRQSGTSFTSPLTTKGDIFVHNGGGDARLPVGHDGEVLTPDQDAATGLRWDAGLHRLAMITTAGRVATLVASSLNFYGISSAITISGNAANFVGDTQIGCSAEYQTGAAANAGAGWSYAGAVPTVTTQDGFIAEFLIRTGSATPNVRYVIGFGNTGITSDDATISTAHAAVFSYSTAVPDTNWMVRTADATPTTEETDTGVAVATNTKYLFRIDARNSASLKFYINGVRVATHATNVPTATSTMQLVAFVRSIGSQNNLIRISHYINRMNAVYTDLT